jgi:hypothetical protein
MNWVFRPGNKPEDMLQELENTLGIQNLTDVKVDEDALKLYIFTDTKKYSIDLTEV